ncbi:MAG: ERCC4-like helicase MPH1 [Candidatus Methanohalarchaeum thermophilum]|uniref:ERCC4-like helicase MPH1 n=1 Tax=Methanohalarchaeum thermophilum TaxID=1903181 RepID=A0A1Q6DTG8_METT1|nr:MAG: ERCC4-like helicase MPH1 [Candidatus Methanohalarchaeum thermophilum]
MNEYISHPFIKESKLEKRLYQLDLAGKALNEDALIVLPTGLGKTAVAVLVIASRLEKGKCLFLSPTKPLVEQHSRFFNDVLNLSEEEIKVYTGENSPDERKPIWEEGRLIVATPQVIKNDLLADRISLENVAHLTFDEAHRGVGDYAYNYIADRYLKESKNIRILGITASPGSNKEEIREVCENLGLNDVEIKTEKDPEVKKYSYEKIVDWRKVELPEEINEAKEHLEEILKNRMKNLKELGYSKTASKDLSKKKLLNIQEKLQNKLKKKSPNPPKKVYRGLSIQAEAIKLKHLIDVLETEGVEPAIEYIKKIKSEANTSSGSKASKRLINELKFKKASHKLINLDKRHPKLDEAEEIIEDQLRDNPDSRVILFTNYRDSASTLVEDINGNIEYANAVRFVGQSNKENDKGLTQKEQVEIIDKFKEGTYNVLVATSVAEEGLDIPSTDLVIFYEPVPSEIRYIQRKGRTGRQKLGKVKVLISKGTKDEALFWASKKKEEKMENAMEELKDEVNDLDLKGQQKISDFDETKKTENKILVYGDHRELNSGVIEELKNYDVEVDVKQLDVGDYILSKDVCVERKTSEDFVSSIIDRGKRGLFDQANDLIQNYSSPLLIIEGDGIYTSRKVHPNAIRGAISTITVDFKIPIIQTKNQKETASYLFSISKREQENRSKEPRLHAKKSSKTLSEKQEYIISSLPMVGPKTAKNLLKEFKTIRSVFNAEKRDLKKVEGVGEKRAKKIWEILNEKYTSN